MKFFVPPRLYPGVARGPGVGFFPPGSVLELGAGEVPHWLLVPMDAEAQAALKKHHGLDVPLLAPEREPPREETMTMRQFAEGMLAGGAAKSGADAKRDAPSTPARKSARAADR